MTDNLTELERRALPAVGFPAFPINLKQIRDKVYLLLKEVGRYGFFDEFTDHSFDHVHGMLTTAEWIIPDETKDRLTCADWLFIVLSIYFHDVGMLISRSEYRRRSSNAEYLKFCSNLPLPPPQYTQLQSKLGQLAPEDAERFLYQEFVRFNHGARIRAWIEGYEVDDDGAAKEVRQAISALLFPLDPTIRRDLALVCESHTKDDVGDTKKYKISQPLGSSLDEAVNLQYVAAILRTVDLLQITNKRSPSVSNLIVNPTDPISQLEWLKQGAVRNVRRQYARDREGNVNPTAPSDTIEVHARFRHAEGFFGLTTYLAYVEKELQACNTAILRSAHLLPNPPAFPWKHVDLSGVEADGFLTESFGFSLDQQKILDLLTGHTLYNDTSVVIRELTQNALDAVRLQALIDKEDSAKTGLIKITWESASRVLTISDNGTGMSQEIIENHLLKVGSSRYQDPRFQEAHPGFSSISRFGIGVLSTFMVSDNVQITTCSIGEEKGRRIDLRSVHGKYLIKLLDKVADRDELGVFPHGTSVRLIMRQAAEIGDILETARMWILFPRCRVTVKIDDREPVAVGYTSPRAAIEEYIAASKGKSTWHRGPVEVRETHADGVTLAFAVWKDELFGEWQFLELSERDERNKDNYVRPAIGTCVEGMGVEFNTPGYGKPCIVAIANAVGPTAPKTNVARSALEDTPEYRVMVGTLYKLYSSHVTSEMQRLEREEHYSLTGAVNETPYIALPILRPDRYPTRPDLLNDSVMQIPMLVVENDCRRRNISFAELEQIGDFWTIESPLSRSIETFVREAPGDVTAAALLATLGNAAPEYPKGSAICNYGSVAHIDELLRSRFEVCEVIVVKKLRRISLRWSRRDDRSKWLKSTAVFNRLFSLDQRGFEDLKGSHFSRSTDGYSWNIALSEIPIIGLGDSGGFTSSRERFIPHDQPMAKFISSTWDEKGVDAVRSVAGSLVFLEAVYSEVRRAPRTFDMQSIIGEGLGSAMFSEIRKYIGDSIPGFEEALRKSNLSFFDANAWERGKDL
jgi:molecular chaperone HtpG